MSEGQLSITEAFVARHSVRTYKKEFPDEKMQVVKNIVEEANSIQTPFHFKTEIGISGPGLGRMGVISGEAGWLVLKIPTDQEGDVNTQIIDAAFRAQVAVMKMAQIGVSTVWIGGTFNQSLANAEAPGCIPPPCVIAFGIEDTPRFMDKAMKFFGGSANRKAYSELFYNVETKTPINEENAGEMLEFFKAIRSGPSAINQQPWRLALFKKQIFVYNAVNNSYSTADMGICLANIYFFYDGHVTFSISERTPEVFQNGKYLITATFD